MSRLRYETTVLWRSLPNVRSASTSISARQYDQPVLRSSRFAHVEQGQDETRLMVEFLRKIEL